MKHHLLLSLIFALGVLLFAAVTHAAVDNDAAVVQLRKNCNAAGSPLDNCFTDLPTLNTWIWNTRNPQPSAATPLLVDIGPGNFTGQFTCADKGHVTLRGAGIQNTVIEAADTTIATTNCFNLTFSQMTIRNSSTTGVYATQTLGGTSYWDNIEIDAYGHGWIDDLTYQCIPATGKHYWFNSRIVTRTNFSLTRSYYNVCDESWFFGSEITAIATPGSASVQSVLAQGGEVHVYGSVIRAITDNSSVTSTLFAVTSAGDAEIHIHGTGIDVIGAGNNNVVALRASGIASIHANQSSYVLKSNGGTKTRIQNVSVVDTNNNPLGDGDIKAPYLWKSGATPPDIVSAHGSDMAMTTDNDDGQPHIVVYSDNCPSKWYDTTDKACRQ